MNLDKEIAAAQRRIRARIDLSAAAAVRRITEPTGTERAEGWTRQAISIRLMRRQVGRLSTALAGLGDAMRASTGALSDFAKAIGRD